jgi:hypothetical protein
VLTVDGGSQSLAVAEPDVAIVEADHPEADGDELGDQLVGPRGQLLAEPHDQQQRIARAVHLVLDGDAVRPLRCHTTDGTGWP